MKLNLTIPRHCWYWTCVVKPEQRRRKMRLAIGVLLFMLVWSGGCMPNLIPQPQPKSEPQTLRIEVVGEGKVNVGGSAEITAKSASSADPLTDDSRVCDCGCAKQGCTCSRGSASAAPTVSNAGSEPQYVTQYVRQQVCENGVCRIVSVPVRVPVARSLSAAPAGKIRVYTNGSAACVAMKAALDGVKGIDFENMRNQPVPGITTVPTAVKPDGSTWTPIGGWHAGSLDEFLRWRAGQ